MGWKKKIMPIVVAMLVVVALSVSSVFLTGCPEDPGDFDIDDMEEPVEPEEELPMEELPDM